MELFCTKCGTQLINGVCPNCSGAQTAGQYQQPAAQYQQPGAQYQQQSYQYQQQFDVEADPNDERFQSFFMNPKEKFVCALGNGYLMNFLTSGSLSKGFAVISDKRVYYKGTSFEFVGNKLAAHKDARTVDLKDVTGTEVASFHPISLIVCAVMFFILSIVLAVIALANKNAVAAISLFLIISILGGGGMLLIYRLVRKTLLKINYAGGHIAVPLNWFPPVEGEKFQKKLRIAKDQAIEEAENAAANALREAMSVSAPQPQQTAYSAADELAKYAQLYKDGLISEQEFADVKAKIFARQ